jgi:hypothetical protein
MSYFEYILVGDLNKNLEEKSTLITDKITKGTHLPFNLIKYYDEDIGDDKKKRIFILASNVNITNYIYSEYFKDCNMEISVYFKQKIH